MWQWLIAHSPLLYFTQSLWRDEAFSIITAQKPLEQIIGKLGLEPPLYYSLLHFWLKLFGDSEIAARSLSLVGLGLATLVVIVWAEKLFRKHWLAWFLPLSFFLNPMLLYYGFEVRAYTWYVFFAVLSMYCYLEKKWLGFVVSSILGFYTHSYMCLVLFVEGLHWLLLSRGWRKIRLSEPFFRAGLIVILLIAPWFWLIAQRMAQLVGSWYYPVDIQLIKSVLGNLFLGYEGTPWFLWNLTGLLSLVLLGMFIWSLKPSKTRKRNSLFLLLVFVPLIIIIGISFKKPLFVNRYLIPVTVAEVFLVAFFIETLKSKFWQFIFVICCLSFVICFNVWYPAQHPKVDIRSAVIQANLLKGTDDLIYAATPLIFFETLYYSHNCNQVYLFNPNDLPFPGYVGEGIFSPRYNAADFPTYPLRAFIIHENGTLTVAYQAPFHPKP